MGVSPFLRESASWLLRSPRVNVVTARPDGVAARTSAEIEASVCEGLGRFGQHYMVRGPKAIQPHLHGDALVVRHQGVRTAAEQHLA